MFSGFVASLLKKIKSLSVMVQLFLKLVLTDPGTTKCRISYSQ